MKKTMKTKIILAVTAFIFLANVNPTFASEVTGTIEGTISNQNPVVTPTPTPTPDQGGGGGGGGGGGQSSSGNKKGDANKDGKVDILDFVILMANWGQNGAGNNADFNQDNRVDILDFVILMANWTN